MTRAEQRILRLLSDGQWHNETALGSSFGFLQRMYFDGLVVGAMKTTGSTPRDRMWKATAKGTQAA
jgi:hypothetical protein